MSYFSRYVASELCVPVETLAACEGLAMERLPFHVLAYGDALSVITPELYVGWSREPLSVHLLLLKNARDVPGLM